MGRNQWTVVQEQKERSTGFSVYTSFFSFFLITRWGWFTRRLWVVCQSATTTNKVSQRFEKSASLEIQTSPLLIRSDPPPCDNADWSALSFSGACADRYCTQECNIPQYANYSSSPGQNVQWPFSLWISIFNKTLYSLEWKQRAVHINT